MPNTYPKTPKAGTQYMTAYLADVSAASKAYIIPGFRGKVVEVNTVLGGAITGADAVVTVKINSTSVTGGAITIANSGSAAGDLDSATPTALNSFGPTDILVFDSDGASSTTQPLYITAVLEPI